LSLEETEGNEESSLVAGSMVKLLEVPSDI